MRLLDLFCGAGGAGMGYHRTGFEVTGVDITDQPRYPFKFIQGDAIKFVREHGHRFDVIHASPPCQAYSPLNAYNKNTYPDLVALTRKALISTGTFWVIENVPGAPLIDPIVLCGPMFKLRLYRERLFETPFCLTSLHHPVHVKRCVRNGYLPTSDAPFMSIHGGKHSRAWRERAAEYMGVPWMRTIKEICEAIPPAYTEYIGRQLIKIQ